ncbi:MAG TPA: hypothetical protein VGN93_04470 [Shinella sp.]|jgi:hypothetical protein|uniref:hypothetical protein n=1 Tax=Shinella sp. TaxID=1870904 RepID=UPI002E0F0594|nr:hypothetical protein [Shinella sp.]
MQPDVTLTGYLCNVRLTKLTRHADGYLYSPRMLRAEARYELSILDSIWVYAVDDEDAITAIVVLRLPGDEGFEFKMVGATASSRELLRLREYLEGARLTEVEAHILAEKIIDAVVCISTRDGVESEAA